MNANHTAYTHPQLPPTPFLKSDLTRIQLKNITNIITVAVRPTQGHDAERTCQKTESEDMSGKASQLMQSSDSTCVSVALL